MAVQLKNKNVMDRIFCTFPLAAALADLPHKSQWLECAPKSSSAISIQRWEPPIQNFVWIFHFILWIRNLDVGSYRSTFGVIVFVFSEEVLYSRAVEDQRSLVSSLSANPNSGTLCDIIRFSKFLAVLRTPCA